MRDRRNTAGETPLVAAISGRHAEVEAVLKATHGRQPTLQAALGGAARGHTGGLGTHMHECVFGA